ncbi:MAG: class I SAM-dependent methyltransferase [Halieaceae bacterium]|jgi:hypothetical protein|nr:class I SAM-dependent methyltransferase [Halieaceae bacterium]
MVGLPGRSRGRDRGPAVTLSSRLLPAMLDEKRLAAAGTVGILDFGRANGASLEFFNQFSCRLCVLDAAANLRSWGDGIAAREEPPSPAQMQLELSNLLAAMGGHRYDLVFLWDTINHLPEVALPAFAALLRRHVKPDFRGHGFLMHKRGAAQELRQLGLTGHDQITVHSSEAMAVFAHNRRVVDDALGRELRIDQGVLHGDGRLEFLMINGNRSRT